MGQAAWRLGVSVREYRELEAGERVPGYETWDRICKLFGWPRTRRHARSAALTPICAMPIVDADRFTDPDPVEAVQ